MYSFKTMCKYPYNYTTLHFDPDERTVIGDIVIVWGLYIADTVHSYVS